MLSAWDSPSDAKMEAFNALLAAFLPLGQWQQMMLHLDDVRGETWNSWKTFANKQKVGPKIDEAPGSFTKTRIFFWRLRWFERFLLRCDMLCTRSATNIAVEVVEAGILIEKNDQQFEMNMVKNRKKHLVSSSFFLKMMHSQRYGQKISWA